MSNTTAVQPARKKIKKSSQAKEIWRRMRKNKRAVVGLIVLATFALIAIFADLIVPYESAIAQDGTARLQPPNAAHWFGTDGFGRDVFARVVHGSRVSLSIGVASVCLSLVVGGLLGAAAGYYGGKIDNIIMRIMDIFICIPGVLLSLAIVAALGTGMINLLIAVTIGDIPGFVRLIRSVIITVVENDYIEAARSYGAKDFRIIIKYILPNAMGPIIVQATMNISGIILAAAGLSFLGMGIAPPRPEWGSMLSDAREHLRSSPYLMYFPGFSILISALCFNLVGDGLRDALDPKLKD